MYVLYAAWPKALRNSYGLPVLKTPLRGKTIQHRVTFFRRPPTSCLSFVYLFVATDLVKPGPSWPPKVPC